MGGTVLVASKIAGLVALTLLPSREGAFCDSCCAFVPSHHPPFGHPPRRLGRVLLGATTTDRDEDPQPKVSIPLPPPPAVTHSKPHRVTATKRPGGIPAIGTEAWNRHRHRLPYEDRLLKDFPTLEVRERPKNHHRRRRPSNKYNNCNGRTRRVAPIAGVGGGGNSRGRLKDSRPNTNIMDRHHGFEVFPPKIGMRRLEGGGSVRTIDVSPSPPSSPSSIGAKSTAPSSLRNDDDDEMPTGKETKNVPTAIIIAAPTTLRVDTTVFPADDDRQETTRASNEETKAALLEEEEENDEETTEAFSDDDDAIRSPSLLRGSGEYFATDALRQILRADADCGQPLESSRTLADGLPVRLDTAAVARLSCGSASCTGGGWPRKTPSRSNAEVFYVLEGFGCLTDIDGTRHYFGPGDTVVVPRNWTGRWDVAQDLHRIWFVLGHEDKENVDDDAAREDFGDLENVDNGKVVPVEVIHYPELVAKSPSVPASTATPRTTHSSGGATASTSATTPHASEHVLFREDSKDDNHHGLVLSCVTGSSLSATLSGWLPPASSAPPSSSVPTSFAIPPRPSVDALYVLEGSMVVTTAGHQEKVPVEAGDTLVLPVGWKGTCDVLEPAKVLRVTAVDPSA